MIVCSHEEIATGCLQRIAAATERMAGSYVELCKDRDFYHKRFGQEFAVRRAMERRIGALRGVITRMRRKGGAGRE